VTLTSQTEKLVLLLLLLLILLFPHLLLAPSRILTLMLSPSCDLVSQTLTALLLLLLLSCLQGSGAGAVTHA
jgi:hypothetical protein